MKTWIYDISEGWLKASILVITLLVGVKLLTPMVFATGQCSHETSQYFTLKPNTPGGSVDSKYIVFVANGRFETVDGTFMKDGLVAGDGLEFQRMVMDRSESEIEEHKQKALDFFYNRFGIDALTQPGVMFSGYEVDPRVNLRAYTVSKEKVPPKGWKVDDGGWGVFVVDKAGITLGGAWEGFHLPFNSVLFYGDYVINRESENLVIHYESDIPFMLDQYNGSQIRCRTTHETFGEGAAGGFARFQILDTESLLLQVDAKNVITFPGILSGI